MRFNLHQTLHIHRCNVVIFKCFNNVTTCKCTLNHLIQILFSCFLFFSSKLAKIFSWQTKPHENALTLLHSRCGLCGKTIHLFYQELHFKLHLFCKCYSMHSRRDSVQSESFFFEFRVEFTMH